MPLFVRIGDDVAQGNRELVSKGAIPIDTSSLKCEDILDFIQQKAASRNIPKPVAPKQDFTQYTLPLDSS